MFEIGIITCYITRDNLANLFLHLWPNNIEANGWILLRQFVIVDFCVTCYSFIVYTVYPKIWWILDEYLSYHSIPPVLLHVLELLSLIWVWSFAVRLPTRYVWRDKK